MRQGCLVPNIAEVTLVCLRPKDGAIEMQLRARRSISTCPACGTASRRVHSHYQRKLADLPWEGLPVVILLQARKFFCVGDSCRRKIFTRATTWHGGALCTAQLPIERSSPLADACLGWPCRSATGTPARTSGVQIDSSALAAASDAADRGYSSARARDR